jgi:hypothetical protein
MSITGTEKGQSLTAKYRRIAAVEVPKKCLDYDARVERSRSFGEELRLILKHFEELGCQFNWTGKVSY